MKPRQPYLLTTEVSEFSVPIPAEVVFLEDEVYGNVHKASSFGRGFLVAIKPRQKGLSSRREALFISA